MRESRCTRVHSCTDRLRLSLHRRLSFTDSRAPAADPASWLLVLVRRSHSQHHFPTKAVSHSLSSRFRTRDAPPSGGRPLLSSSQPASSLLSRSLCPTNCDDTREHRFPLLQARKVERETAKSEDEKTIEEEPIACNECSLLLRDRTTEREREKERKRDRKHWVSSLTTTQHACRD